MIGFSDLLVMLRMQNARIMQVWAAICIVMIIYPVFESIRLPITLLVLQKLCTDIQFSCMKTSWYTAVLATASHILPTVCSIAFVAHMQACKALFVLARKC